MKDESGPILKKKKWNGIPFRLTLLKRCNAGERLFFVFKPKKNAFKKMSDFLNRVFSKISNEENPAEMDELDVLILSNPEFVRELAMRKIAAKAFLYLSGFIQIYTISGQLICSDNGNFHDFTQLIGGLENPEPERSGLHGRRKVGPRICFKMFGTVPSTVESN